MNHAKRKYLLIWRKICYHRYDPTSKRDKTETDIAHEIYVWFTEEEEIYKPSSKTEQPFTHLFRVNSNLFSHAKTAIEANSTDRSCG